MEKNNFLNYIQIYNKLIESGIESISFQLDDDFVWKRLELFLLLEYFESIEEYEKCFIIKKHIESDLIANESKQNELNIGLSKYFGDIYRKL